MTFRVGILGGGLQGTEAACLARWAGWDTTLADARPAPPASGLAHRFVHLGLGDFESFDLAFSGCDLVVPACEDLPTLELLSRWGRERGNPVTFDLEAYRLSSDKVKSKELFRRVGAPTPASWPEAAYPLMAKPVSLSGSREVRLLESEKDFKAFFGREVPPGWLAEEYCPGPSYSLEVTGRPGAHRAWVCTALEMDEVHDCREVRAPAGLRAEDERAFRDISLKIAAGLGLTGLMDVETILTPEGFRVLEIDARLPSQTPAVVWWSSGENLLTRLAADFCGIVVPEAEEPRPARAVVYEHVLVEGDRVSDGLGEHVIAAAGPLTLREGFCGADWAVTDYRPGREFWTAVLITIGSTETEVRDRRRENMARIKRDRRP